jgi:hypothetical protein
MAGDVQRVEPGALRTQATEMKGQNWHNPAEDPVTPPDALPSSGDAIANLNENAQSLKEFEHWAEVENRRIAEMLDIAATAYQKVDDDYGRAIENPERIAAVEAIIIPEPPTQPPQIPGAPSTPRVLDAGGYSNVDQTQAELTAPDAGTSLKTAMLQWGVASKRVENNKPKPPPGNWEGEAADAAYARMAAFGSWLTQLSEAWYDLAEAAAKIAAAHDKAKSAHDPIHKEYVELEARLKHLAQQTGVGSGLAVQIEMEKIRGRMEELQAQSDEVRRDYASSAAFSPVRPADPPATGADGPTATTGGGGPVVGDGADRLTGHPKAMAQKMAESLSAPPSDAGSGRQSGDGGGGPPSGGGSPAGSGTAGAGGGEVPGGAPSTSTTTLPTDPGLQPAAASGGGGAKGGGPESAPMSPAVTAETVAPGPPMPVGPGQAATTAATGLAGGGMAGGMAPMHGAPGGVQGKEKRRDPRTAPDEDLYTEDRPWTEGVVGNRRRREVHDGRNGPDGSGGDDP